MKKNSTAKQGFTLVELITVIAVLAVVMGISVIMIAQLFDFQRNYNEYSEQQRDANRFAAAFREDVHTYCKPEIVSEGDTLLRWTTETETVEYTKQPGSFPDQCSVVRTVRKEDQERREIFQLPDRTTLSFTEGKENDAGLVALSLWTTLPGTETPKLDELNPFDRTVPKSLEQHIDPKYAGNWRTIVARY